MNSLTSSQSRDIFLLVRNIEVESFVLSKRANTSCMQHWVRIPAMCR